MGFLSFGQVRWSPVLLKSGAEPEIKTSSHGTFSFDGNSLKSTLKGAVNGQKITLNVPLPDGSEETFILINSEVVSAGLQAKFPNMLALKGTSVNDVTRKIRVNYSPESGFHAMILDNGNTVYVDPFSRSDASKVISYYRKDFVSVNAPKVNCKSNHVVHAAEIDHKSYERIKQKIASGTEHRNYRIAVAATGEYTQFHGGTVNSALAAIVTTINRVGGIYTTEVGISFTLIADNDQLIFTNGATDPFSNNDAGSLIDESQTQIDNIIGNANYDIGHTVSTGGGGLASLGVPCVTGRKASGITGSGNPVGDPYDVDYVAHEIGHQFGAPHTFNGTLGSCSGNGGNDAYEPGSGVTIMAYAGICSSDNIANNSIPYFHSKSFDRIVAYSTTSNGNNCPTTTSSNNSAPVVEAGTGGFVIPVSTPFQLTGSATDADGDDLTYMWEQYDLGPSGAPDNPSGDAPIFRVFEPESTPTRYFPQMSDIVNNTSTKGEILPTYDRNLNFRLIVRDDNTVSGGVDYDLITFTADDAAGPFLVSIPSGSGLSYSAGQSITVSWDVANTDQAPINCSEVNILLSTDGGYTYDETLLTGTANDGSAQVTLPISAVTTSARIKIEANDNIFFDISNNNFSITTPTVPDFSISSNSSSQVACEPTDATYEVSLQSFVGFSESVTLSATGLPAGAVANFSSNPVTPTASSTLTISGLSGSNIGDYTINIEGTSTSQTHDIDVSLEVAGSPGVTSNLSPVNADVDVVQYPTFTWDAVQGAVTYEIQVSTGANFVTNVVDETTSSTSFNASEELETGTIYFWRVRALNTCGDGAYTSATEFTTINCVTYEATDLPVNITDNQNATSTLTVAETATIADINVLDVEITHTWIGDVELYLVGPDATEVHLYTGDNCENDADDMMSSFDDDGGANIPCAPTDGNAYQPEESLGAFTNKAAAGIWTLKVYDDGNGDIGTIDGWKLQLCLDGLVGTYDNVDMSQLEIYPNPASASLTVKSDYIVLEGKPFTLTNQFGQVMIDGLMSETIDMTSLDKGIYILNIESDNGTIVEKIIKE